MKLFIFLVLLTPVLAFADQWQPYPDGGGGCWVGVNGMWGCTPRSTSKRALKDAYRQGAQDQAAAQQLREAEFRDAQNAEVYRQQQENDALRQQLASQQAAQQRRERAEAAAEYEKQQAAWAASPAGRAQAAALEAQRQREREEERLIQANALGPHSLKTCKARGKVPTCTDNGCVCQ